MASSIPSFFDIILAYVSFYNTLLKNLSNSSDRLDKLPYLLDGFLAFGDFGGEELPGVKHVGEPLEFDGDTCLLGRMGEPFDFVEEELMRSDLDEEGWKVLEVAVEG